MYETFQLPETTTVPDGTCSVYRLNLDEFLKRGELSVVDLSPGTEYLYTGKTPVLLHVTEGVVANLKSGEYIGLGMGEHLLRNEGPFPSRLIIMELFGGPLIPGTLQVSTTPFEDRPLGIRLQSLARHVIVETRVGFEHVGVASGHTIPAHAHTLSGAIGVILKGTGYAARRIGRRDIIEAVGPGSVVYFQAGMVHGFHAIEDMVFDSAQDPDISHDYVPVRRPFKYP